MRQRYLVQPLSESWTDRVYVSFQAVYNQAPDYTREGGSIPVTLTFAEALGVNVLLLPMGRGDDGAQYVLVCPPATRTKSF